MNQQEQKEINIKVSKDIYDAIQQLKQIFSQLTGQQVNSDEDVIGILVSSFIQSLVEQEGGQGQSGQQLEGQQGGIILQ